MCPAMAPWAVAWTCGRSAARCALPAAVASHALLTACMRVQSCPAAMAACKRALSCALVPACLLHCRHSYAIMYGASPFQQALDQGASLALAVMK